MWQLGGGIAQTEDVEQDEDGGNDHQEKCDQIPANPEPPAQCSSAQEKNNHGPEDGRVARDVFGRGRRGVGADRFRSHDLARFIGTREFGGAHQ